MQCCNVHTCEQHALCLCYTNPFCDQHNIVAWKMLHSLSANQKSVLHSTDQWGARHHVTSHPQPWQLPGVSTKPVLSVPCPSLVTTNFPKFWQKPIVNQGRGEVSPSSLPVTSHHQWWSSWLHTRFSLDSYWGVIGWNIKILRQSPPTTWGQSHKISPLSHTRRLGTEERV